jgi:uncharacterized protein YbjT (DUF2867 family)
MPVVVTGATGLVGRRALEAFARSSPQVRAYVRRPDAAAALRALGVKTAAGEIDDVDRLAAVMAGAHTVCHLIGGLEPPTGVSQAGYNVGTLEPVVAAAERAGVRRFLYLSYPGASPQASHPYLAAKGRAEELLASSAFESVVIRCTHVYGPGGTWIETVRQQARRTPAVVVGGGRQVLAPVFVDDVARVLAAADDRSRATSGVWGLEGPDRVTADELTDLLAGRRTRKLHLRAAWAAWLSRLGGRPTARDVLEILSRDCVADSPDAAAEFAVARTPLREGLARTFGGQASTGPE